MRSFRPPAGVACAGAARTHDHRKPMSYGNMDGSFQLSHTGSGGMTSSLSVGTRGSAAVLEVF